MFIVLEGGEAVGKTSQMHALKQHFEKMGREVVLIREPGGTAFGEDVRPVILKHYDKVDSHVQMLTLAATKLHLLKTVIRPALADGKVVIADRYTLSMYTYQGVLGGVPAKTITSVLMDCGAFLEPGITFLLTADPCVSVERLRKRGIDNELDTLDPAAHERLTRAYETALLQSKSFGGIIHTVDTTHMEQDDVTRQILSLIAD